MPITLGSLHDKISEKPYDYNTCTTMLFGEIDYNKPLTWGGALDRSPFGTDTCTRMTALYAHGKLGVGEDYQHESITGLVAKGKILETCKIGDYDAIIPQVTGSAWICGLNTFVLDETDPFSEGFTVGDIW